MSHFVCKNLQPYKAREKRRRLIQE